MLEPLSRDTLRQQTIETLKRLIITENLQAGDQLPSERELSEVLAVSRNVVREALSALVAEGIVVKRAGRGAFVADFDRTQLNTQLSLSLTDNGEFQQLKEARAVLEIGILGLVVNRITKEELQELEQLVQAMEEATVRGETIVKGDLAFHSMLLSVTKNQVLQQFQPLLAQVIRVTVAQHPSLVHRSVEDTPMDTAAHREILEAIRQRDVDGARRAMKAHMKLGDI